MRGVEFEPLRRYSVGIICAKSCPLAKLSVIRPSVVPPDNLIGYRAAEFPEYHQWVAKVLGVKDARHYHPRMRWRAKPCCRGRIWRRSSRCW
jgi:hypothetical protein